jgi:tetratricopeptide (TPR) repeat protein
MLRRLPVLLLSLLAAAPAARADGPSLEERVQARLLEGIAANFAGDYDKAEQLFASLSELDPAHPAREVYLATVIFWRINADPSDPRYDQAIFDLLEKGAAKAEARLDRDEKDLVALHYMGLAYTYRGRLEAQRGCYYRGGSDGEKGRDYLERALLLCQRLPKTAPQKATVCEDVRFPLGAYSYYAGRLPGVLRALSFLWFVPRGSCAEGLRELERSRERSALHGPGARSLLASIYGLFEENGAPKGLALARELSERNPDNPFLDADLSAHLSRNGEHAAAAAQAERVLVKVRAGLRNYTAAVELMAELALAEAELGRGLKAEAAARLVRLRAEPRFHANSQTPRIALAEGMLADLGGDRAGAERRYRECKEAAGAGRTSNRQVSKQAEKYLETPYRLEAGAR